MEIENIIIFDYIKRQINKFEFSSGVNLFVSKSNTIGKSSLIKSIYHNLGFNVKIFPIGWNVEDMIFKITIKNVNYKHTITRHKDLFYIGDSNDPLNQKDFSRWLQALLNIEIMVKEKKSSEVKQVYASEVLLPFYIDQDKSWNGYVFSKTSDSFGRYTNVTNSVFDLYFGISNKKLLEYQIEKDKHSKKLKVIESKIEALALLEEQHNLSENIESINYFENLNFDENLLNDYISLINFLNKTINSRDLDILEIQKQANLLVGDIKELENLYNTYIKRLKGIEHTCIYCNSSLTEKQSLTRLKIRNNVFDITEQSNTKYEELERLGILKNNLEKDKNRYIDQLNILISKFEDVEKVKEVDSYIENKAHQKILNNYLSLEQELNLQKIEEVSSIKSLVKDINLEKKNGDETKLKVKEKFEELKAKYELELSKINLNNIEFYKFSEIKGSGNNANKKMLAIYVLYSNLINEFSKVKLPFAMDSFIKNETAEDFKEEMFAFLSKNYLSLDNQVFFSIIEENLVYLSEYKHFNLIHLERPILSDVTDQDESLIRQFEFITIN